MINDPMVNNPAIVALIDDKKDTIEGFCRDYFGFLQEEERKRDYLIDNCTQLIDWANEQTQKIKDSVFVKQAKPLMNTGVELPSGNINEICSKLEDDVDCIVNSRTPLWLSSVCYVFSHQWRKVVYEEIIKNYVFVVQYAEKEIAGAKVAFSKNIAAEKQNVKNKILEQVTSLLQDIHQQIDENNASLL